MLIAIDSLLFLIGGIALGVLLTQLFARRPEAAERPVVKLVRMTDIDDSHEETQLLVNDVLMESISDEGLRQADYAMQIEDLEATATRLASALGVSVELSRVGAPSAVEKRVGRAADVLRKR
jgi:hypothetical protein